MTLTRKQMEFWSILLAMAIGVSVLILIIDFGIKGAILEESTRLRLRIEEWERGRSADKANANGASNDAPVIAPFPSDLLVDNGSRVEKGDATAEDRRRTIRRDNSSATKRGQRGTKSPSIPPRDK